MTGRKKKAEIPESPQDTAPVEETTIAEAEIPDPPPQDIVVSYRVGQQVRLIKDIRGVKAGAHGVIEGHSPPDCYKISYRGRMYWVKADDLEAV